MKNKKAANKYYGWWIIIIGIISVLSAFYIEHLNADFVILFILGAFIIVHGLIHLKNK